MRYPSPLVPGCTIAVTALSAGVPDTFHARLDLVIQGLRDRGFKVLEGHCLRESADHVSAPAAVRAKELMAFLLDDRVDAILPPWGGELAMELLPLLDLDILRHAKPKWLVGFSDISTISSVLTARCGWASLHCANLMQLHPDVTDPLNRAIFSLLSLPASESLTLQQSSCYEVASANYAKEPEASFTFTQPTQWTVLPVNDAAKSVAFSGRLIGGCLDTIGLLSGTEYLNLPQMKAQYAQDGLILFLENAELSPTAMARMLMTMKFNGVFDAVNGVIFGRDGSPLSHGKSLSHAQVIEQVLGDLSVPVILNADIGHLAPNMPIMNGAVADVQMTNGKAWVQQTLR
ncbi:S66 peptidase family protein [Photobacterium sp. TLY01]|uniref:S66 family peptidase n=1 Tax=Photobacterium sp. TLY01 TaxID=2907534 RepID=UPI001F47FED9|nr:S66 peptidase family protein [Photobacterium sp. TLY01]UIP29699.1 LD-carboxypeptidase [Photobacterium sp. TLY01]